MNSAKPQARKPKNLLVLLLMVIILGGLFYYFINMNTNKAVELNYNTFKEEFFEGDIKSIYSTPVGGENYDHFSITGIFFDDATQTEKTYTLILTLDNLNYFVGRLQEADVTDNYYTTTYQVGVLTDNMFLSIIISLIPTLLLVGLIIFMMRNAGGGNNKAFDFGKNRAKLSNEKTKTFKDVAGCDEEKEELAEIIDFLKNPKKYASMGARIPKGVLLAGPPGTGKTLLAKAVSGEASVPFFSISGSDFVEMFVGVGASRVRDLFKVAKENAPCIIFIDEIDAVGRQRGAGMGGGNDEREQTLNQLLVEMDGFSGQSGIIMIAATNRPDVLDPALLRPGRFDRQVTIGTPDIKGRVEILKVHARNKKINPLISFEDIAQRIPGFSGADIENLLNESALLAARDNRTLIELTDIDEAVDRVMMGPAKKTKKFTEFERKLIAHHEAGHAVIGLKLDNSNVVQKVTIIPRGNAGGYALMLPEEETFLETKNSLLDRITGFLGGRVAEELIFNEISTGAHNDFQQATKIARAMVTEYGMSKLGPVQYEVNTGSVFLGRDYGKEKNFSNELAHEIDNEVRSIIEECYQRCITVLEENKELLLSIADYLLKIETLTKQDILEIEKTGKLKWYAEKLAKDKAEKAKIAKEAKEAAIKAEQEAIEAENAEQDSLKSVDKTNDISKKDSNETKDENPEVKED